MSNNNFHIGVIICTIAFAINVPLVYGATDPNIFVNKYEEYLRKIADFSTTSDVVTAMVFVDGRLHVNISNSKIYISGDNVKLEGQRNFGNSSRYDMQEEMLSTSKESIRATVFLGKEPEDHRYDVTGFLKGRMSVISNLSESLYFGMENFESVTRQSSPAIFSILKQAKLAVSKQDRYYILTANGNDFKAELWFDPVNQGAPTKIIYNKLPENIHLFGLISISLEVTEFTTVSGISVPVKLQIQRERAEPKPVIDESGERVPISVTGIQKYDPEKDGKRVEHIEVTWENTELKPIPDSAFKMEKLFTIPSGTTVRVFDDHETEYIWNGGKIIPKSEYVPPVSDVVAVGDESDFVEEDESEIETETNISRFWGISLSVFAAKGLVMDPESHLSLGWVIALGILVLLILIVCGVKMFRHYRKKYGRGGECRVSDM